MRGKEADRLSKHKAYSKNPEPFRRRQRTMRADIKLKVLSKYGPEGRLQCSWSQCEVNDPDMLTLDHVGDNGAEHRKQSRLGTEQLYRRLLHAEVSPEYQTLCWNHQWKKELMRRRELYEDRRVSVQ